jgi:hypothetical protein
MRNMDRNTRLRATYITTVCLGIHCYCKNISRFKEGSYLHCRKQAAAEPNLKATLARFKGNAGISLQWIMFGSGGHVQRPKLGGPLQHYTRCSGQLSQHQKCLMNSYFAPSGDAPVMPNDLGVHACSYRCD